VQKPKSSLGRFIFEVSRSHTIRPTNTHTLSRTPPNKWLTSHIGRYLQNKYNRRISMPSARFKPAVPAIKRSQTNALDCTATGIGWITCTYVLLSMRPFLLLFASLRYTYVCVQLDSSHREHVFIAKHLVGANSAVTWNSPRTPHLAPRFEISLSMTWRTPPTAHSNQFHLFHDSGR
jgi:hypothetical protein